METVEPLVARACAGEQEAWNQLVERYLPLVGAVVRKHRLWHADADDVHQTVWLRLVEHIANIREPAALPGWIATTTRNECLRVIGARRRAMPIDPTESEQLADVAIGPPEAELLALLEHQALREALDELPEQRRRLLLLLLDDPPAAYAEISELLGIPIGSIGPSRARALEQLRNAAAIRALSDTSSTHGTQGRSN